MQYRIGDADEAERRISEGRQELTRKFRDLLPTIRNPFPDHRLICYKRTTWLGHYLVAVVAKGFLHSHTLISAEFRYNWLLVFRVRKDVGITSEEIRLLAADTGGTDVTAWFYKSL